MGREYGVCVRVSRFAMYILYSTFMCISFVIAAVAFASS